MSGRLKAYMLIILATLIVAFLLSPPLAFASKLPTTCNIFHKKTADKAGPCGHWVTFSKMQDKSFEVEAVHFANAGLLSNHFTAVPSSYAVRFLEIADLPRSNPLRC